MTQHFIRFQIVLVVSMLVTGVAARPISAHPTLEHVRVSLGRVHSFARVAISPDGQRLAWTQETTTRRHGHLVTSAAIFVAPVGNRSAARRITGCPHTVCDDDSFAWAPNSMQLAFLTTNDTGQAQLALANAASGRARLLTHAARGPLADPKWSPDGKQIAFLYTKDGPKSPGPLNPLARAAGVLDQTFFEQRIAIVAVARESKPRLVSPADLYVYEYDWSPDAKRFAATAAHGSGDDNWWIADLYTIGARDGVTKKIHHPRLQIASPRWSADGKRIAYIGGIMSDESITGGDLYVVSAAGGAAIDATPHLPASVIAYTWNGSPNAVVLTQLAGGVMSVEKLDVDRRTTTQLWSGEETIFSTGLDGSYPGDGGVSISRNGARSAIVRQSFTKAPELYVGPIGAWRQFTRENAATPRIITHVRNLTWTSDSFKVQGWLVYPVDYRRDKRYPLVVIVHGGPASANFPVYASGAYAYDAFLASQGYFVLEPNPRGSYGQGETFAQANIKDFGGGDLRDILRGVDATQQSVAIDANRIGIFGHSYGGFMTMWALTQTHRFRAAVTGAGLSNWLSYYGNNNINSWMLPYFGKSVYDDPAVYAKSSPIDFIKGVRTPTLLYSGDRDAEVPIEQSYEYWNALRTLRIPTTFVVYPDEGHAFHAVADQADVARRTIDWFNRWLR